MSIFRVIGAGSPLVDYTIGVDDRFLQQNIPGGKGGTIHIAGAERRRIFSAVTAPVLRTPGGAAANTISALGKLQIGTAFLGKLGNDDDGNFFRQEMAGCGVSTEYLIFPTFVFFKTGAFILSSISTLISILFFFPFSISL